MFNLSKVALDSAASGIEPAISNRKSNALTTAPPRHTHFCFHVMTCCGDYRNWPFLLILFIELVYVSGFMLIVTRASKL